MKAVDAFILAEVVDDRRRKSIVPNWNPKQQAKVNELKKKKKDDKKKKATADRRAAEQLNIPL